MVWPFRIRSGHAIKCGNSSSSDNRAQWRKLAQPQIPQVLFDGFENTRKMRHAIVHRALRLTLEDRGRAQRAINTSRWLFNKIENKPDRETLREKDITKSLGRIALTVRFPSSISDGAVVLQGIDTLLGGSGAG